MPCIKQRAAFRHHALTENGMKSLIQVILEENTSMKQDGCYHSDELDKGTTAAID
jgi:hypothetical protein